MCIRDRSSNGTKSLKILGFHFSKTPTAHAHVESLRRWFFSQWWILYHLKHHGFNREELVTVYKSIIRPVFDYCAVVYHALLTDDQDQLLERLQRQALKVIYGAGHTYTEMREMAGITTLRQRRVTLCDKFAAKCADSDRFGHWFRLNQNPRRSSRGTGEKFAEEFARCKRYYNSPLFFMRRRVNGKVGLEYWERHRERRQRQ